jgi:hypothetical protein
LLLYVDMSILLWQLIIAIKLVTKVRDRVSSSTYSLHEDPLNYNHCDF